MQCGAKCKATGEQCRRSAVSGRRVCQVHGGATPTGYGLPQTRHGRYSRDLPTRLAGRYREALTDPELISVREEIALVDARTADLLGRVDTREAGFYWSMIAKAVRDFQNAKGQMFEQVKQAEAFARIEACTSEGTADYAAWAEVLELVERRRKLAETETKRLAAMGQQITAERAMLLLAAVVDVIRRHVTERDTMAAISREIGQLVNREGP